MSSVQFISIASECSMKVGHGVCLVEESCFVDGECKFVDYHQLTGGDRLDAQEQPGSEQLMRTFSPRTSEFTPSGEKDIRWQVISMATL